MSRNITTDTLLRIGFISIDNSMNPRGVYRISRLVVEADVIPTTYEDLQIEVKGSKIFIDFPVNEAVGNLLLTGNNLNLYGLTMTERTIFDPNADRLKELESILYSMLSKQSATISRDAITFSGWFEHPDSPVPCVGSLTLDAV